MENAPLNRPEELSNEVQQNEDSQTKQIWQKPALEKFPLNEAQTGSVTGLSDSELFS